MESSANIHNQHHQHQDRQNHDVLVGSSSSLAGSTTSHPTNNILHTSPFSACLDKGIFNSRNHPWQQNMHMLSSVNSATMTQDLLGFHGANINPSGNSHLSRIKHENNLDSSCSTELITETEEIHKDYLKNAENDVLLRKFPSVSGYGMNGFQQCPEESSSSLSLSGSVQMFPTTNVSNFYQMSNLVNSSSVDMNSQGFNLLNTSRFEEGFGQIYGFSSGSDHLQQSGIRPIPSPNNISSFTSNVVMSEAKRSFTMESKAPQQAPTKKPRMESRASCPPFKVRKEKLGDRVAALQQLVAPFGKTDTASVLMEAFGYIKFLQNQVETLSIPYMKSSRIKTNGSHGDAEKYESEKSKQDLRSRGLCLVPSSCLSCVTDSGGGVWPPPTFDGSFSM